MHTFHPTLPRRTAPGPLLRAAAFAAVLLFVACEHRPSTASQPDGTAPPQAPDTEGPMSIDTPAGRATAELLADRREIRAGESVLLRVVNHGIVTVTYGRPIRVERWDGRDWVETQDSRDAAWTMDLIILPPGERGVEQRWPFLDTQRAEPGWYRFTKPVQPETAADTPGGLVLRTRVQVVPR